MRNLLLLAVAAGAIAAGGCNKRDPVDNAVVNETAAIDADLAADGNTVAAAIVLGDADFANTIAAGGRFEIDSGGLAASQAASAELKSLAAMIAADHQKAGADLKAAAAAVRPTVIPSDTLSAQQLGELNELKATNGAAFDTLYVSQQIAAHQEALAALHAYGASGASSSLRAFATRAAAMVQSHLDRLNAIRL
jgi:putative membrane protein